MQLYDWLKSEDLAHLYEAIQQCEELLVQTVGDWPRVHKVACHFHKMLVHVYLAGEGWILSDVLDVLRAERFGARSHQEQTRKDAAGTPYIVHPLQVATLLLTTAKVRNHEVLIAALLHDTVEDTPVTIDEIKEQFGSTVQNFVAEVTDDPDLDWISRKDMQVASAKDLSSGAAQIKLADKYCNLRDILHHPPKKWSFQRADGYVRWAQQVVERLPWVNANLQRLLSELFNEYHSSCHRNETKGH